MLNSFIPHLLKIRSRFPRLFSWFVYIGKRYLGQRLGVYPRPLANEVSAVAEVLRSSQWNMAYGKGLVHERLEAEFADYVGAGYAIAVNTGGMALQMSMRALGLKPGNEVIMQVDTCSATAQAIMNAGCTPIFADISESTFMLSGQSVRKAINPDTRAIVATHMWGNPENMVEATKLAQDNRLYLIEDACLALGAIAQGRHAGTTGNVGVYSFGCIKPIQGGEGGMIVTNDEALARELRAMRHWGDRTIEYGTRDVNTLSWNGRLSEIVAAVVREQLKGYPAHLDALREALSQFQEYLGKIEGVKLMLGAGEAVETCSFTQAVLQLDASLLRYGKDELKDALQNRGIPVWHANFEPVNSLSLFKNERWREWSYSTNKERVAENYRREFPAAYRVFNTTGLGLGKTNFLSRANLDYLIAQLDRLLAKGRK